MRYLAGAGAVSRPMYKRDEIQTSLTMITAPVGEPITVDEAISHLRLPEEEDEELIETYISIARQYFEDHDDRRLLTQTWLLTLDRFPYDYIEVPLRPLQVVNSIKYRNSDGTLTTLDPANYQVDTRSFLPRISPAFNIYWPYARCQMNAVEVEFVVGYGDAVTMADPLFDGTNYFLTLTPSWLTTVTPSAKTTAGFHVEFDTAAPANATLDVLAQAGRPLQLLARETFDITEAATDADLTFTNTLPTPSNIVGGIPLHLKQALLLHVGHLYENREDTVAGVTMMKIPMGYQALISPSRRLPV